MRIATLIVGAVFSVAAGTSVQAADLIRSIKGEPYASPFSWSGWYAGLTAGGGWGKSRFEDDGPEPTNTFDMDGFVGGVTVGLNQQFHRDWVAGIEADISYSGISGSFGPGNLRTPSGAAWSCRPGACETDIKWFGTLRGRLGYASGNFFLYGTGGLAFGKIESGIVGAANFRTDDVSSGWTLGGGLEYALAPRWSVKVEYLHIDLGWSDRTGILRSDSEFDVVRAGINYRFGE